jgi:hypothetical protein
MSKIYVLGDSQAGVDKYKEVIVKDNTEYEVRACTYSEVSVKDLDDISLIILVSDGTGATTPSLSTEFQQELKIRLEADSVAMIVFEYVEYLVTLGQFKILQDLLPLKRVTGTVDTRTYDRHSQCSVDDGMLLLFHYSILILVIIMQTFLRTLIFHLL